MSSAALDARAREVRSRAAIRAWEYRQRNLAKGAWVRFVRLLAGAESVWAIPCEAVAALEAEGFARATVGDALEPPRTIVVVPAHRIARIAGARRLEVRMSGEMLTEPCIALAPFLVTGVEPAPD